jgi:hypothetical protein
VLEREADGKQARDARNGPEDFRRHHFLSIRTTRPQP